ncbi:MAG: hypothetical protein JWQ04_3134, partial [Pedosphaera sp.]|nr:hypothetical protein [Pedosphaera sp.]
MIKPNTHLRNGKSRTRSEINAPVPAGTPIPLAQPMPAPRIIAPARPAPRLPCSPAMRLEELINEGLDCLGETPPNLPAAAKFLAAAEREAADRELPVKLANRMRFFRDSLDRIRKDLLRGCIDRELKEVRPLLELTPPKVDRAAEELQAAAALLKEAPDPYLQLEMEHLHRKICFLEKKLRRRRTVRVWPFFASFKRPPSDQFQNALGLIAVASLLLVAGLWLSRPASRGIAELNVNVIPSEAELFTNGIPVGGHNYPVRLRGLAGGNISLEARLAGYSILSRSISLPAAGHIGNETIELQPAPGILVVQSEPAAPAVWLREEGRAPVSVRNALQGIEIHSGLPVEVSLALADYAPINRTLPPFKPGERRVLDFGALAIKTSSLRLKVEPDDADFLLAYAGLNPVAKGSTTLLAGLAPKVPFQIIAERKGYLPQTNTFTLKPGEVRKCDFGRLQPLPASLVVLALPHPFEMRVEWAGGSSDFGAGEAAGLPPGKPLVVTISADGCEAWATNLVLEPGEARTLTVGQLPIA